MDSPPSDITLPACRVQREGENVAFVVDGQAAQSLPAAMYDKLQVRLSVQGQVNAFELQLGGGRKLEVRLVPIRELETGPVDLRTEDGIHFGRRYRIAQSVTGPDGVPQLVIVDADTGAEVERLPRDEFAELARAGRMRSDTAYDDMLGQFNGRLYFAALGKRYAGPASPVTVPAPPAPAPAPEAPAAPTSPEERAPAAPEEEAELPPWRQALRHHPRAVGLIAAASFLVLLFSVIYFIRQMPSGEKIDVKWSNARSVDAHLDAHLTRARFLVAADFRQYATAHPDAARQALRELRAAAARAEEARLTNAQQAKLQELRAALKQLDEAVPW